MLRKKIVADQIQSLKNHDQEKLSILRYILAQIKNKEIDKKIELIDEEIITVLRKIAKELNESIEAFKKEIEKIVAENKEIYDKNPEAIIGVCVGKLKNKAESSRIVRLL